MTNIAMENGPFIDCLPGFIMFFLITSTILRADEGKSKPDRTAQASEPRVCSLPMNDRPSTHHKKTVDRRETECESHGILQLFLHPQSSESEYYTPRLMVPKMCKSPAKPSISSVF